MKLLWVPPGSFTMGSPPEERSRSAQREAQVSVTISKGFYLGKFSVTQAEFKAVVGRTPWAGRGIEDYPSRPANIVDWHDAADFCQNHLLRSHRRADSLAVIPTRCRPRLNGNLSCRAGTSTAYCFGDDEADLEKYAKKPNAWGFCCMNDNLQEWCRDRFRDRLPGGTDPCTNSGDFRALCCGRSAQRIRRLSSDRLDHIGFRVALIPSQIADKTENPLGDSTVTIVSARWGDDPKWVDVTIKVRELLDAGKRVHAS